MLYYVFLHLKRKMYIKFAMIIRWYPIPYSLKLDFVALGDRYYLLRTHAIVNLDDVLQMAKFL